jgi:hypothetical protein
MIPGLTTKHKGPLLASPARIGLPGLIAASSFDLQTTAQPGPR